MRHSALSLVVTLLLAGSRAVASTYTVTTTADSGAGSLRQAITDANTAGGTNTIAFDIPGSGVHTITPLSGLPLITNNATVDGYTQPGASANTNPFPQPWNGVILIELDGENLGANDAGLHASGTTAIRGLAINRCKPGTNGAIFLLGPATIAGNLIGLDPTGLHVPGTIVNSHAEEVGVWSAGTSVIVGGDNPADRNVISGNTTGIYVYGSGGTGLAIIRGNFIGTDITGTQALPNGFGINGISCSVTLGGAAAGQGNLLSGNAAAVSLQSCTASSIQGNLIGTDASGTGRLSNFDGGINIISSVVTIGGLGAGEANTIAHNGNSQPGTGGVIITAASPATVRGNRIFDNVPLGIDLWDGSNANTLGPTPNDATEADGMQNYPIISSVDYGASTTVHAAFHSNASQTFMIDFYANPACLSRPPALTEGQDYVGTTNVMTDASGNATIDFVLPVVLAAGQPVAAIATNTSGQSSEFSESIALRLSKRVGQAGDSNTVYGQLFESGSTVTVGGLPATVQSVPDAGKIFILMPSIGLGTVSDVTVDTPSGLSGTLKSAWVEDFLDSNGQGDFSDFVTTLVANSITAGVGGGNYGYTLNIKRQSMAVFILKAEHGVCYTPPACAGVFPDVPCTSNFAPWIEAMAAEGITSGCGGGNFCPSNPVRRDQMAVFLLKGEHGSDYVPPPCVGLFTDVPCPGPFSDWIEQLKNESITSGCGNGTTYCPANNNTRAQMAVFVVKAFGLQ